MPKASHHHALARQWELLRLLPSRLPGITATELANRLQNSGFVVSKRTIERDLSELSTLFGIACNDKGTPYGWYWMNGEPADLPGISITDAISLNLIEEFLRPLVPAAMLATLEARFRQAKKKLEELSVDNKTARWIDKVRYVPPTLALIPPKIIDGVLETIQEGLLTEKQVLVRYHKPASAVPHELILHPLGIVQRGAVTYLVATAFDYSDVRLYAAQRIEAASLLDEDATTPPGFSLETYVAAGALQFGSGEQIALTARINQTLFAILEETPLAKNQQITAQNADSFLLTADVLNSWQLRWWILSQGANIEIISPPEIRDNIRETLSSALVQYKKNL